MTNKVARRQSAKDAFKVLELRHCHYCGALLHHETLTLDHIVPRGISRTNVRRNLVPCCAACNNRKGNGRSRCVCSYCEAAWEEFAPGVWRAVVERMAFRVVGPGELAALRLWSDVSETKKFVRPKGGTMDHVFIDATEQPERCPECGGRDFTCGRCGTYFVDYHQSEVKRLKLRVVELTMQLADAENMRAAANREVQWAYRDAVPIRLLASLPEEWRSMLSLRVEDVARELETILGRWREQREQETVAREVRGEADGDGSAAQR